MPNSDKMRADGCIDIAKLSKISFWYPCEIKWNKHKVYHLNNPSTPDIMAIRLSVYQQFFIAKLTQLNSGLPRYEIQSLRL
jgi:hypothetical protein